MISMVFITRTHTLAPLLKRLSTRSMTMDASTHDAPKISRSRHLGSKGTTTEHLIDEEEEQEFDSSVWRHNAWDDLEWTPEMEADAEAVISRQQAPKDISAVIDDDDDDDDTLWREEGSKWDKFYAMHDRWFFKDRKWLTSEFPELSAFAPDGEGKGGRQYSVLEVGCGAGNTVFPLLRLVPSSAHVYACDFSTEAVNLVKSHAEYDPGRCTVFQHDLASDTSVLPSDTKVDLVLAVFVLSAIHPSRLAHVISKLHFVLKPGGVVLFRDYGRMDLTQLRLPPSRFLCSPDYYRRGDGTLVHFFTETELATRLFTPEDGWRVRHIQTDKRLIVNRKRQLLMRRVWVQGRFVKDGR